MEYAVRVSGDNIRWQRTCTRHAAAIQSLFATTKLNGIEPAAWLKDTLEKLPTWSNSRIDELLLHLKKSQIK